MIKTDKLAVYPVCITISLTTSHGLVRTLIENRYGVLIAISNTTVIAMTINKFYFQYIVVLEISHIATIHIIKFYVHICIIYIEIDR